MHSGSGVHFLETRSNDFYANLGQSGPYYSQHPRGCLGQIDDASSNVGSAIDDRDDHEASVSEMGDAHAGAEGQGSMRRGGLAGIEDCTARRSASCFSGAIP